MMMPSAGVFCFAGATLKISINCCQCQWQVFCFDFLATGQNSINNKSNEKHTRPRTHGRKRSQALNKKMHSSRRRSLAEREVIKQILFISYYFFYNFFFHFFVVRSCLLPYNVDCTRIYIRAQWPRGEQMKGRESV